MPIPYRVDDLEKVPEVYRSLYKEKTDNGKLVFIVDVEGASPKEVVDDFRQNNIALREHNENLLNETKAWQEIGLPPDQVRANMLRFNELTAKIDGKELIAAEGFQKALETKVQGFKEEANGRIAALEKRAADAEHKAQSAELNLKQFKLDTEIQAAAIDSGVKAKAMVDVRGRAILAGWSFSEDGRAVLKDANGIAVLGSDGYPLSLRDWMQNTLYDESEHLFEKGTGGSAPGNSNGGTNGAGKYPYNPWDPKVKPNLTLRSKILSENPALAEQMKRQVGYTKEI